MNEQPAVPTREHATCAHENVLTEWNALLREREDARARADAARIRMMNLAGEPSTSQNRAQKTRLVHELRTVREESRSTLENIAYWIRYRRRAVHDRSTAEEIKEALPRSKVRLDFFEKTGGPDCAIENEKKLIWKRTASLEDLEQHHRSLEETFQPKIRELEEALALTETAYHALRRGARNQESEAEKAFSLAKDFILEWGCRDTERLCVFLDHDPHRRSEVLRLYKERHPDADLSAFSQESPLRAPATPTVSKKRKGHRRANSAQSVGASTSAPRISDPPWAFIFVDEALTRETVLDSTAGNADHLSSLLHEYGHHHADPQVILDGLQRVTRISTQERQLLNKLVGVEPHGWKIVKAGRYRLFLEIDEKARRIRFLVRPRKEAYAKRHRT